LRSTEAIQVVQQDLREAVSVVVRDEYEREMERAKDSVDLRIVQLWVMRDRRLSENHRARLLKSLEDAIHWLPPWTSSEHLRLQAKTRQRMGWRSFP